MKSMHLRINEAAASVFSGAKARLRRYSRHLADMTSTQAPTHKSFHKCVSFSFGEPTK